MSARIYEPVAVARQFRYVREVQPNKGLRVNAIQTWSGGQSGDSWCMEYVWLVFDICYQGQCPFGREQSTETFRQLAVAKGWVTTIPIPGDIVLSLRPDGTAHHVGIITKPSPLTSIAGNTSDDGSSAEGDRVAEHWISTALKMYVAVPSEAAA